VTEVPVLMLTAHDTEMEKVRGLQAGADDYVTKPFGRQELLARVSALLRRAGAASARLGDRETFVDGDLEVDVAGADVRVKGSPVQLTPLEFRLLLTFLRNPGQVLSREQLLELVWGDAEAVVPTQVKVTVSYLRSKLKKAGVSPITTVRGFGYKWVSMEEE
jgi:DNA-binding response OmpR family regulator